MDRYDFPKNMKHLLRIIDRFSKKPVYEMSSEEIQRLSSTSLPNNPITRKILKKEAFRIEKKTLHIPAEDHIIPAYLFTQMEKANREPETVNCSRPLILFFHGGGWVLGHTVLNDFYCSRLASILGAVVLSVDYRLAPEHRFPCAADDAYQAYTWAARHTEAWGTDRNKIFLMGSSAGGNLAAVTAMRIRDLGGKTPSGQILIYPVTDATMSSDSYRRHEHAPQLDRRSMEFFIEQYASSPEDISSPYFSPLLAASHEDLPPALVITAEYDPLHDEGIAYARKLQSSGVETRILECEKTIHSFINYPKANGVKETEEAVMSFVEEISRQSGPGKGPTSGTE